jgi:hypothetical protein
MIKDPLAIRDFARICFDPQRLSRLFRPIVSDTPDGALDGASKRSALAPALLARRRVNTLFLARGGAMQRMTTMERAFHLARSGRFACLTEMVTTLNREGYSASQVQGPLLKR